MCAKPRSKTVIPTPVKAIIRKVLPYSAGAFFLLLLVQGITLLSPVIMQQMLDYAIPERDVAQIILLTVAFVGIPILSTLGHAFYQYSSAMVSRKNSFLITRHSVSSIIKKPMTFHDQNTSGELAAQAGRDASGFISLWTMDIPNVLATLVVALGAMLLLARMHPSIALFQLLYIPCILLPSHFVGKRVNENSEKIFANNARMRAFVQEIIKNVKTIKLGGMTDILMKRYEKMFTGVSKLFAQTAALELFMGGIASQMLSSLFTAIGFLMGVYFLSQGVLTAGAIVSLIALLPKFHAGLNNILSANIQYMKQLGEYQQMFSYFEQEEEERGSLPPAFLQKDLRASHVRFRYENAGDAAPVLRDVSLALERGQWVGIEGVSGAGKSTLLDLLLRLYEPTAGVISLDGTDLRHIDRAWYWSNIAYVGQNPFLFTGTLRENFSAVAPGASEEEIIATLRDVCLDKLLERTEDPLGLPLGEDGAAISGGEKQRIALAMALLTRRPLLVLDEVTSQLDKATQEQIGRMLRARMQGGLTILSISHRQEFNDLADVVIPMEKINAPETV